MASARTQTALPRMRARTRKNQSVPTPRSFCNYATVKEFERVDQDHEKVVPNPYFSRLDVGKQDAAKNRLKWKHGDFKFTDSFDFDPLNREQTMNDPYTTKVNKMRPILRGSQDTNLVYGSVF